MIKCIAIDEDREVLSELTSYLEKIPFLSMIGTFSNPLDANRMLALRRADIVFIDPEVGPIDGIDFVRNLRHNQMIIFITKSRDYAVEAYNMGIVDYIIKPLTLERLLKVANKVYELYPQSDDEGFFSDHQINEGLSSFFLKVANRVQRFSTNDILFIEGCSDYVRVYKTGSPPTLASINMKNLERKLPFGHFCRVHRSFIVSINKIDFIEHKRIRIGEHIIPVSKSYYPLLVQVIDAAEITV